MRIMSYSTSAFVMSPSEAPTSLCTRWVPRLCPRCGSFRLVQRSHGLLGRTEFMLMDTDMGILCRGGDQEDYVVADLIVPWKDHGTPGAVDYMCSPEIASLCFFSSREGEWTAKEMLVPQPHGEGEGEIHALWQCDRVVPFAGRFLYWIDYYSGILLCDLSNDKSPMLYYKPFPGKQYPDEDHLNSGQPEASRSVSVSQGMLRFVDIDGQTTITIWNLETAGNNFTCQIQNVINISDLWAQQGYQVEHLTCRAPEFPAVAKSDPDVLCCVLREHYLVQPAKVWIIIIDMKHATFRSCLRYVDEHFVCHNKNVDTDNEIAISAPFCIELFLPTDFSKYLNSPSGTWKMS